MEEEPRQADHEFSFSRRELNVIQGIVEGISEGQFLTKYKLGPHGVDRDRKNLDERFAKEGGRGGFDRAVYIAFQRSLGNADNLPVRAKEPLDDMELRILALRIQGINYGAIANNLDMKVNFAIKLTKNIARKWGMPNFHAVVAILAREDKAAGISGGNV